MNKREWEKWKSESEGHSSEGRSWGSRCSAKKKRGQRSGKNDCKIWVIIKMWRRNVSGRKSAKEEKRLRRWNEPGRGDGITERTNWNFEEGGWWGLATSPSPLSLPRPSSPLLPPSLPRWSQARKDLICIQTQVGRPPAVATWKWDYNVWIREGSCRKNGSWRSPGGRQEPCAYVSPTKDTSGIF